MAIKLIQSSSIRQKIAKQQSAYVCENHTTELMADAYNKLYKKILNRNYIKLNTNQKTNI